MTMGALSFLILIPIVTISVASSVPSETSKKSMLISRTSGVPPAVTPHRELEPMLPISLHPLSASTEIPAFKPDIPPNFLHLENSDPLRVPRLAPKIIDGTEYGESPEHFDTLSGRHASPRSKHFLRHSEIDSRFGKERKHVHSTLDIDASADLSLSDITDEIEQSFISVIQDIKDGYKYMVGSGPSFVDEADSWAQETRGGFMGYFEKLRSILGRESKSVGNKLFEAADAYSHRFFNLVHVKESEHPALAAKVTRILVAIGLSLTLVFIIFAIALHLQRTLVTRAHEEAAKQIPLSAGSGENEPEQIFFAMPPTYVQTVNS